MVIYIHGFGTSGLGGKGSQFREYFKSIGEPFIAPSLSYVPELAIATLEELVESYDNVKLMGSSLGGYYAMHLAEKHKLKAVLINPTVDAFEILRNARTPEGQAKNYYDNSSFLWLDSHVETLKKYEIEPKEGKYLLMLQKEDQILDYTKALTRLEKLPSITTILEEGGTHAFANIERHHDVIRGFFEI